MSRLEEIQARADAATPGPWEPDTAQRGDCVVWGPNGSFIANQQAEPHWLPAPDGGKRAAVFDVDRRDCEFIAHAREDVPWLIARVRRLVWAVRILRRRTVLEYRRGYRDGYRTARADIASGAYIGGPNYEALKDAFAGQLAVRTLLADAWDEGSEAMYTRRQRDESLPLTNPYRKPAA